MAADTFIGKVADGALALVSSDATTEEKYASGVGLVAGFILGNSVARSRADSGKAAWASLGFVQIG